MEEIEKNIDDLLNIDVKQLHYFEDAADRMFWLDTEVDEGCLNIAKSIMRLNMDDQNVPINKRQPIFLFIHSIGGEAAMALLLVDTILASKTPVFTINMGMAYSAAANIYLAGTQRLALRHSGFLFHKGEVELCGTIDQINSMAYQINKSVTAQRQLILEQTHITAKRLDKELVTDWYIPADEAVELGVAHRVIESIDEVLPFID